MKISIAILLFTLLPALLSGQTAYEVRVYPESITSSNLAHYKPGIFYTHFYLSGTNALFDYVSGPEMYNSLRETKFFSECWTWSSSQEDVFTRMRARDLKSWLLHISDYTDRVVVKFNSMPYWLSRNKNTDVLNDKSWREFMTHPPDDWDLWAETVSSVVDTIASWGIHPYYELWNEPDGEYWKGSNDELLELYRRTALAVKGTDPLAKVGGFGMHTWWRSTDPGDNAAQQPYMGAHFGHKPEQLPERYAILYSLLDSVTGNWRTQNVALDFISYHHFNHNTHEITRTAEQLNSKMRSLGYCDPAAPCPDGIPSPELYISEWQTTYGVQEQHFQPALFLRHIRAMGDAGISFHSIAALNDFIEGANDEFIRGWGLLSRNNLVKPVYKSLLLLSDVIGHGNAVESETSDDALTVFAGISSDTLRVLISNYNMPVAWYSEYPKYGWSAFERLLYDRESVLTRLDYMAEGHSSWYWGNAPAGSPGTIDRIIHGQMQPFPASHPLMTDALKAARAQYSKDSTANSGDNSLHVMIPGNSDTLRGYMIRIDSSRNNVIRLYDSLRSIEGFSHTRAIDSLQSCYFPGGCYGTRWQSEEIVIPDSTLTLVIQPNSVVYLQLTGVSKVNDVSQTTPLPEFTEVYPIPAAEHINFRFRQTDGSGHKLEVRDVLGRVVYETDDISNGHVLLNRGSLLPGIYLFRILRNGESLSCGSFLFL